MRGHSPSLIHPYGRQSGVVYLDAQTHLATPHRQSDSSGLDRSDGTAVRHAASCVTQLDHQTCRGSSIGRACGSYHQIKYNLKVAGSSPAFGYS
ncbi:hypothetical protein KCU61_g1445, partial [Aureobasidium melanogenum]